MRKIKNSRVRQSKRETELVLAEVSMKLDAVIEEKRETELVLVEMSTKLDAVIEEKRETELVLAEMSTKLDAITKVVEKEHLEQEIDRARLNIRELRNGYLDGIDMMMKIVVHWNIPENVVNKASSLKQYIKNKSIDLFSLLNDGSLENISSLAASNVYQEVDAAFDNIWVRFENLAIEVRDAVAEDEKLFFKETSQRLREAIIKYSISLMQIYEEFDDLTRDIPNNEIITQEIAQAKCFIRDKQNFLVKESFSLEKVPEINGADRATKEKFLNDFMLEFEKYMDNAIDKVNNILENEKYLLVLAKQQIDAKQQRQRQTQNILFIILTLMSAILYVCIQYFNKQIPFDQLRFDTWIFVSIILISIYMLIFYFVVAFLGRISLKKKQNIFSLVMFGFFEIIILLPVNYIIYYIAPSKILVVLLPAFNLFAQPSYTLSILLNLATITGLVSLVFFIIKFCKFVKKQIDKILNN